MKSQKQVDVPADFAEVLQRGAHVRAAFEAMRPSCQREYV